MGLFDKIKKDTTADVKAAEKEAADKAAAKKAAMEKASKEARDNAVKTAEAVEKAAE